jgi:hypothetical protein
MATRCVSPPDSCEGRAKGTRQILVNAHPKALKGHDQAHDKPRHQHAQQGAQGLARQLAGGEENGTGQASGENAHLALPGLKGPDSVRPGETITRRTPDLLIHVTLGTGLLV